LADQLQRERALQRDAGRSSDFLEGVRSFREKRKAAFTGR
jgi:2-(1,2-epoxy-1,2-dihydrophenyl)acetyl-CoA isomerase